MTLEEILDDDSIAIILALADIEPGYATALELSWQVAGEDKAVRTRIRRLLNDLERSGTVQVLYARHRRGKPLEVVYHDPPALLAFLARQAEHLVRQDFGTGEADSAVAFEAPNEHQDDLSE